MDSIECNCLKFEVNSLLHRKPVKFHERWSYMTKFPPSITRAMVFCTRCNLKQFLVDIPKKQRVTVVKSRSYDTDGDNLGNIVWKAVPYVA